MPITSGYHTDVFHQCSGLRVACAVKGC